MSSQIAVVVAVGIQTVVVLWFLQRSARRTREVIMDGIQQVDDALDALRVQFDNATSAIGARIQKILDELAGAAQGVPVAQVVAELNAKLAPELAALQALGQDPANPVPGRPPVTAGSQ